MYLEDRSMNEVKCFQDGIGSKKIINHFALRTSLHLEKRTSLSNELDTSHSNKAINTSLLLLLPPLLPFLAFSPFSTIEHVHAKILRAHNQIKMPLHSN